MRNKIPDLREALMIPEPPADPGPLARFFDSYDELSAQIVQSRAVANKARNDSIQAAIAAAAAKHERPDGPHDQAAAIAKSDAVKAAVTAWHEIYGASHQAEREAFEKAGTDLLAVFKSALETAIKSAKSSGELIAAEYVVAAAKADELMPK